ncbi:MarR family transcriptional regulator [Conexibacter sp. SYSU D00693]|uniref:MarR family transcriptional regulator n=1 Tax=Conexibacter sp. SYSU D00693 TaxID=2812560 RepID=UPI00196B3006|nr:MarR family transcriptional regulator [Conexibacter sp. SYSU D00693]
MAATTRDTPEPEATAFAEAVDAFVRAQRRARGRANRAPEVPELSFSQYHLLEPLVLDEQPLSVSALAQAAGVSAPSATRMIDGLEHRGIVERIRAADDRRVVRVVLTEQGRALAQAKRRAMRDRRAELFAALPAELRTNAAAVLNAIALAMERLH